MLTCIFLFGAVLLPAKVNSVVAHSTPKTKTAVNKKAEKNIEVKDLHAVVDLFHKPRVYKLSI
jgi:hypothetical protein